MNYYFIFDNSQEDIPTLIVYRDDRTYFGCNSLTIINIFSGDTAKELFNKLTQKPQKPDIREKNES